MTLSRSGTKNGLNDLLPGSINLYLSRIVNITIMKKLIISNHVTLDGFVAGPNGEMDMFKLPDGLFDFVGKLTESADSAMYGRKTFEMMDNYWPTAGDKPNAGKHEIEHSAWYNKVDKYVLSNSMKGKDRDKVYFLQGDLAKQVNSIKQQGGGNILLFGSPAAVHSLMADDLVDEFYLFINPVLLGQGIPMFKDIKSQKDLKLKSVIDFDPVVCLRYERV